MSPLTKRLFKFIIANCVTNLARLCHYPFDTVCRRMQMDVGKKKRIYKGSLHCFGKIFKDEGIRGFYRGCLTKYIAGFGGSFCLVLYDDFSNMLSKRFQNSKTH